MTRHYCTLFNEAYLPKGLALHESLLKHSSEDFVLHILACDMNTFWLLSEMKLSNVEVIPLGPFETALKLEKVRQSRTLQEYLWTLASALVEYLLPWFDQLTYLDADIFFYSDPKVIFDEIGDRSIAIVPHRFNDTDRRRLGKNGEYNVGVVSFRSNLTGLGCAMTWAAQCRDWCFNRNEEGRFGDQKYLDEWPARYGKDLCVIENIGVNLGPWAVGNYNVIKLVSDRTGIIIQEPAAVVSKEDWLVCYHFHEFVDRNHLTNWKLRIEDQMIYKPYVEACERALVKVRSAMDARLQEDPARA